MNGTASTSATDKDKDTASLVEDAASKREDSLHQPLHLLILILGGADHVLAKHDTSPVESSLVLVGTD